jgi:hypothetical protein
MRSPARSASRVLIAGLLAASLLVGLTGSAIALEPVSTAEPAPSPARATAPVVETPKTAPTVAAPSPRPDTGEPVAAAPAPKPASTRVPTPASKVQAITTSKVEAAPKATSSTSQPTYRGRNHIWIPSLSVSRDLTWFPCSRSQPPGHRLYQWGCAGRNNVYVFAHAASVFRQLHDAYVSGRLKKGMRVIHADGNGRIRTYRVRFWRVVSPIGADWAFAAQSTPSMTLQTCVGARSQHRLVVRLTTG